MPTSLEQVSMFHVFIAVLLIPTVYGFLMEAGKDLYNTIRKKGNTQEEVRLIAEGMKAMCKETRSECASKVKEELAALKQMDVYMLGRQQDMREARLPRIESKLESIEGLVMSSEKSLVDVKTTMGNFFKMWDENTMKRLLKVIEVQEG